MVEDVEVVIHSIGIHDVSTDSEGLDSGDLHTAGFYIILGAASCSCAHSDCNTPLGACRRLLLVVQHS